MVAKSPGEQQKTDRERIPEQGTGKLDRDAASERTRRRPGAEKRAQTGSERGYASPDAAQDLGQKTDTEEHHD
jgi:hypothetical protein